MARRRKVVLAALLLALASGSAALAADPADLAYWTSIAHSHNPDELAAYLHAFPNGQFAGLAQVRLDELRAAPSTARPVQTPPSAPAVVTLEVTQPVVRAIDRIELDVDATALHLGSNFRLGVFGAETPDAVADTNAFLLASTAITPQILHMTIPPGPAGDDEVRLLYIPQFGARFVVAARTPIKVLPVAPGTMLAGDLTAEAKVLGPVRFEAKYRDRPIKVEGQFLRVEARTSGFDWDAIVQGKYAGPRNIAAIYIGALGTESDSEGPTEVLCLLPGDERAILNHVAALTPGDDVVVTGTATAWTSVFGSSAVIFDRCRFER